MNEGNLLRFEKSPYLYQHKDNPVNWLPWGPDAFGRAVREDKPIFLSIGYSTCYWCHVMEHDSFEKEDVAKVLNDHFISVKVDREERPDIDHIYMDAVVALTGRGGWPLSIFLTPDCDPFWGGTFFFHDQFLTILKQINAVWQSERERLVTSATALRGFLSDTPEAAPPVGDAAELVERGFSQMRSSFDNVYGGFGQAPKFPPSQQVAFLLRYALAHAGEKRETALAMAYTTLHGMERGGLHDHVGGGFHRYSVDEKWCVPHFEKMLYDNAILAGVYLDAYGISGETNFRRTAAGVLEYLLRDLRSPEGAFYSAEDAGEVGKEGLYYVWTKAELRSVLSKDEFAAMAKAFDISKEGNFERGACVLCGREDGRDRAEDRLIDAALMKLFEHRVERRDRPRRDEKILTAWNAMTITALCRAYQLLREPEYLEAAKKCARFIEKTLMQDGRLLRRFRDGEAKYDGYLEDYAYYIEGLLTLYESDFDKGWLELALRLQEEQERRFFDDRDQAYFFAASSDVPYRKKEFIDSATPSGNSVSFSNLLRLDALFPERNFRAKAQDLLSAFGKDFTQHPMAFAKTLQGLQFVLGGSKLIVLAGRRGDEVLEQFIECVHQESPPGGAAIAFADAEHPEASLQPVLEGKVPPKGEDLAYICAFHTCGEPVRDIVAFRAQVAGR